MAVFSIPKAPTYGKKDKWQISKEFREDFMDMAKDMGIHHLNEEDLDDVIVVLHAMGRVLLKN